MAQPTYTMMRSFLLRTPLRPLTYLHHLTEMDEERLTKKEMIRRLLADEDIKQAIQVASPTLFAATKQLEQKSNKDIEQMFHAVLKYYIRMCSRPTPFGLFSAVGLGRLDTDKNDLMINLDAEAFRPYFRFSHDWLYMFIGELEKDAETFKHIVLYANQLVTETKSKYHLSFYPDRASEKASNIEEIALRKSPLLSFILAETAGGRSVRDIISDIQARQGVPEEKIVAFLQRLVEKDFLLSQFRVSSSVLQPVELLRAQIADVNRDASLRFEAVCVQLQQLNEQTSFDEKQFQRLTQMMKDIVCADEYVHIDGYYQQKDIKLPQDDIEENLSKLMDWYVRLAPMLTQQVAPHMDFYYQTFIDRYGFNNAICVKTLLEDKTELGPPPTYSVPFGHLDQVYAEKKQASTEETSFFRSMLYEALLQGKEEIDLTEMDGAIFESQAQQRGSQRPAQGSFDLYVSLYAENEESLKNGDYRMYPSGNELSPGAGKTFGRFLDLFPDKQPEIDSTIGVREAALHEDALLVNVNIHPAKLKAGNVMHASNDFPYELSFSSLSNPDKEDIALDDLYVYAAEGRFHLFSQKHGRKIVPLTSHMVNYQYFMPNLYRFVFEAASYNTFVLTSFHWGEWGDMPYVPRVVAGKAVLSPAIWQISLNDDTKDVDAFIDHFFSHYKVPRYVKCVDHDHFLMIDTKSKAMMVLFKKELQKKKKLRLCEAPEMVESSVVSDGVGRGYANEFIFSMFLTDQSKKNAQLDVHAYYDERKRQKALGSDWFSMKLYHARDAKEAVLQRMKTDLFAPLDEWFYILYMDPEPHIRLRVKVDDEEMLLRVIRDLHTFLQELRPEGLLRTLVYEPYMQEVERYGGPLFIEAAEAIFCADSALIMPLYEVLAQQKAFKKEDFALFTASELLGAFLPGKNVYEWLQQHVEVAKSTYKPYRTLHKNRRAVYDEAVASIEQHFSRQLSDLKRNVSRYVEYINEVDVGSKKYQNDIVLSFLHMHLNRYGIHGADEHQLLQFLLFQAKENFFKQRALQATT